MEWVKKHYDQFILLVTAVLLLAVSVLLILKALNFGKAFGDIRSQPVKNTKVEPVDAAEIAAAAQTLKEPPQWTLNPGEGSLFVGRQILLVDGQPVDPRDAETPIYPPVPNSWILDNGLDIQDPSVLSNDPDGDGFSNLEEFTAKTDPMNAESHPDFVAKLRLVKFIKKPFRLLFPAYDGNPLDPSGLTFQINTLDVNQPTQFLKLGDKISGTKFKIEHFEYKTTVTSNGVTRDISELTIKNVETGEQIVLVLEKVTDSPDSYALLKNLLDGKEFQVKKGRTFKLLPQNVEFKLIDISENNAVIEEVKTGKQITVPKLE